MTRRQRVRARRQANRWRRQFRPAWRRLAAAAATMARELGALARAAVETHEGLQALKCDVYRRGLPT